MIRLCGQAARSCGGAPRIGSVGALSAASISAAVSVCQTRASSGGTPAAGGNTVLEEYNVMDGVDTRISIDGYSRTGITVNGTKVEGGAIVLPGAALSWAVGSFEDVTPASLGILLNISPPVEILLLGTGEKMELASPKLRSALRARGVSVETMSSPHACATFNVLNQEDRAVAAAILPLDPVPMDPFAVPSLDDDA